MLHIVSGSLTGDPLTSPIRQRGAPIQAHGELQPNPRPAVGHALHEANIEVHRFGFHEPRLDGDTRRPQGISTLTADLRIGVLHRENDACNASRNERVDTGRSPSVVATRLESRIYSGAGRLQACSAHSR